MKTLAVSIVFVLALTNVQAVSDLHLTDIRQLTSKYLSSMR